MKILLIEDSKFQRVANERALVKAEYSVIQAGTAKRVSVLLARTFPILILLDYDAQSVGTRCSSRSQGGRVRKTHPRNRAERIRSSQCDKTLERGRSSIFYEVREIVREQFISPDSGSGERVNSKQKYSSHGCALKHYRAPNLKGGIS
jgi:hypothetical protein